MTAEDFIGLLVIIGLVLLVFMIMGSIHSSPDVVIENRSATVPEGSTLRLHTIGKPILFMSIQNLGSDTVRVQTIVSYEIRMCDPLCYTAVPLGLYAIDVEDVGTDLIVTWPGFVGVFR